MCPVADIYELRNRPKKRDSDRRAPENLPKKKSRNATENACLREEATLKKSKHIKEIKTIPAKITILHAKKEIIIVKTEEDPRKPGYFAHI